MIKVTKWLDNYFEEACLAILICMVTGIMFLQIVMRFVFKSPLIWSDELARYCFVLAAFLSPGYCIRRNVIIRVDVISSKLSQKMQRVCEVLMWIGMLFLFCWLAYANINVIEQASKAQRASTALGIPMDIMYSIPEFGFLLAVFRILQRMYGMWLKPTINQKG